MKILVLNILSIVSGMAIVTQSSLSGQLSQSLKNSLFSTFCLYSVSALMIGALIISGIVPIPTIEKIRSTPVHLWFLGSIFSIAGLGLCYWLMPQMGVSKVLVGVIAGQVLIGSVISHFGLFGLPEVTASKTKVIGILLLLISVYIINKEG